MKLLRHGAPGAEKPGLMHSDGTIRDLSGLIDDLAGAALSPESLARLAAVDAGGLPEVAGNPRLGPPVAERLPVRVPASELALAIGDLLGRHGHRDAAAARLRADLRVEVARALHVPVDTPPDVLVDRPTRVPSADARGRSRASSAAAAAPGRRPSPKASPEGPA